jgi:DNA-binding CsgD family transcriptional regulator
LREVGDRRGVAFALVDLGRAAAGAGDAQHALGHLAEALTIRHELGDRRGIAEALEDLAVALVGAGRPEPAAHLIGSAEALREAVGAPLAPRLRAHRHEAVQALRARLGSTAFAAALSSGRTLSAETAVAEGLTAATAILDAEPAASAPASVGVFGRLTPRELDVLLLLADGRTDKEIGDALFISYRTAMGHVANILGKLGLESRTAAAAYALRHGLA